MLDLKMTMMKTTAVRFFPYWYCCHPLRNYCLHHQRPGSVGSSLWKRVVPGRTKTAVANCSCEMMWLPYLTRSETPLTSSHTTTKIFSHKWKEVRNKSFSISIVLEADKTVHSGSFSLSRSPDTYNSTALSCESLLCSIWKYLDCMAINPLALELDF